MKIIDFLREWAVNYVRNKDIFTKTIVDIEQRERELTVRHKHKEHKYFIDPFLESVESDLKNVKEDSHATIVCFNTRENLEILIKKWNDLAAFRHLNLIFVNPNSALQKFWAIFPYTHSRIADEESLELGLKSMFEQVEVIGRKKAEEVS